MAEIIYPFKKYNYKVLIDQTEEAGFSEVSSPDITADPIEYREGNMAGKTPGKQPGILKYSNVTLKRGTTDSLVFWDWIKEILLDPYVELNCEFYDLGLPHRDETNDEVTARAAAAMAAKSGSPSSRTPKGP